MSRRLDLGDTLISQDPNQPPQPQWDAQQGRWVLPDQPQPQYVGNAQQPGQTAPEGHGQPSGGVHGQQPPEKPKKRRVWPWLVGGLFLFFVIAVGSKSPTTGTNNPSVGSSFPSATVSQAGSSVVFDVSGSGRSTSISYGVNGNTSQENGQQLPWEQTVSARSGFGVYALTAQSAGSDSITCRITVDGQVVAQQTSTGQYAVVSCSGSGS